MISKIKENKMEMTFEDKINLCFHKISEIDKPDFSRNELNHFADFVELLAIFSQEDGISYGDIQDRFFGEPDECNSSERNDINEVFINNIYSLIEERIVQYGDLYPFIMGKEQVLILQNTLSSNQKLYLLLLLSSTLYIFKSFNTELTTDFETICCETMKIFLPNAIVKPFGKNSEYTGTASEKIKKLASDIGLPINQYEIEQIGERNTQERGLDIVGWLPFKDNCHNLIVYLCQCACGKNYEYKQHDTRRFENYYDFYNTTPQHTLFLPYSLIDPKVGKFYHSDYIERNFLIFERMRILYLIKEHSDIFYQLRSKDIVERCIVNITNFS